MNLPDRIPYDQWINSQLSIARFWGAANIDGEEWIVDGKTRELVRVSSLKKKRKSNG